MYKFTIYLHKTTRAFRLVNGEHIGPTEPKEWTVRIYHGVTEQQAIHAAYDSAPERVREQLKRFFMDEAPPARKPTTEPSTTPHYKRAKSRKRGLTAAAALAAFALAGCTPANLVRVPEPAPTTIVCVGSAPFATCSRTSEQAHKALMQAAQPRTGTRILPR